MDANDLKGVRLPGAPELTPQEAAPAIALALAALTGKPWQAEPARDYAHYRQLLGPDRMALGIGVARERGKFSISVDLHQFKDQAGRPLVSSYGRESASINVGRGKAPAQIARDIMARLMPDAERLTATLREREREAHAHGASVKATADRIADAFGGKVYLDRNNPDPANPRLDLYHSRDLPKFPGDVVPSAGGVKLDRVYLGADEAIVMLRALAEYRKIHGTPEE